MIEGYKRNYHPLIILLYANNMLSYEEVKQIPKTTKHNWNKFNNENYYGHEWAIDYINKFESIKEVYSSKYLYRTTRTICNLSSGFKSIVSELTNSKKALNNHAKQITFAINHTQQYTKATISSICKFYGVSRDWYYKQKKNFVCGRNLFNRCPKQHPNQLTDEEIGDIENLLSLPENRNKPKTTVYYDGMNKGILNCSKSTFSKYGRAMGYKRTPKKIVKPKKGYRASAVFEALHIDVTFVPTVYDGVQKVAFVKDNKSKALLHVASTEDKADSLFIKNLLADTFEMYGLFNHSEAIQIVTDGGPENKGCLLSWIDDIKAPPVVKKITASTPDFPFSNSMSESTHKIYKSEFMQGELSINKEKHLKSIAKFMNYYNNERYPGDLLGYTPMEVLKGKIPDPFLYSERINEAKINRRKVNQNYKSCNSFMGCGVLKN